MKTNRLIIILVLSGVAVFQIFPLVWLVINSLNTNADLFAGHILKIPETPRFSNFLLAWNKGKVPQYFFNSTLVCIISCSVTVYLSFTLAYAFTRIKWKGQRIVMLMMMLGIMIPIHVTLLPNYIVFTRLSFDQSYLAMLIPYIAFSFPLGLFIMTGYLESVPRELEESGVMDGCGVFSILFRIIFPVTKPAIVAIIILTFLNCWNEYIMAATFLNNAKLRTLPFSVMKFTGEYGSNYVAQFAVMALSSLPSLLIYFLFSKRITSGIMMGAVKG